MSTRTILETAAGLLLDLASEIFEAHTTVGDCPKWPRGEQRAKAWHDETARAAMGLLWLAHDLEG